MLSLIMKTSRSHSMENKPQERGSSRLSLDTRRNSFKPRLPANAVVFNVGEATLINGDAGQPRRKWEARSMESNSCCRCCEGGVEAGLQAHDAFIQFLRQKERRLQRMAQFIALAALVLVSGALALVITVGLGGRCHPSPDSQAKTKPDPSSSDGGVNGQQASKLQDQQNHPSAMLTAPTSNNTNGKYLQWENKTGNAYCHGGFSYYQGDLVVPRKGVYRVFLQITYEFGDEECVESVLQLNSKVLRLSNTYDSDMHLLSAIDTVQCKKDLSKSLYTSGLFSLDAKDKLRVLSSHRKYIAKNEHQVFFGAELLP